MALDLHRRAEDLMADGDRLTAMGRPDQAAEKYYQAAQLEFDALQRIPSEKVRTRGIIATSAVALYRKAAALSEAARLAHAVLAREDLDEEATRELEDFLDEIRDEQRASRSGQTISPESFDWSLRGDAVATGRAPIELVLNKIRQIDRLAIRVYEHLAHYPLRRFGPIPTEVREGYEMLVSQPSAGSFRFSTRFQAAKGQLQMFDSGTAQSPRVVTADALSEQFARILALAEDEDNSRLESLVANAEYREAFLRILRDIAPDGRELREVEVARLGHIRGSRTVLRTGLRQHLSSRLSEGREPAKGEAEIHDVLRAVHLNNGWIILGAKGSEQRCYVDKAVVLEDVVEGLMNRPVRVAGRWRKGRFLIDDIEEWAGE